MTILKDGQSSYRAVIIPNKLGILPQMSMVGTPAYPYDSTAVITGTGWPNAALWVRLKPNTKGQQHQVISALLS